MKKALIIFILITASLLALYYVSRSYIIPTIIAESIKSDNPPPAFLPDKMEKTVTVIKKNINEEVEKLPIMMKELNLSFDDLLYIIDHIKAEEVMSTIDELNQSSLNSTNQVYDIVMKNIHIEGYDLEIFRPVFINKVTIEKINKALITIEKNQLQTSVSIPVARNTAKKILLDNREKIESELSNVNGG